MTAVASRYYNHHFAPPRRLLNTLWPGLWHVYTDIAKLQPAREAQRTENFRLPRQVTRPVALAEQAMQPLLDSCKHSAAQNAKHTA